MDHFGNVRSILPTAHVTLKAQTTEQAVRSTVFQTFMWAGCRGLTCHWHTATMRGGFYCLDTMLPPVRYGAVSCRDWLYYA